MFYSHQLLARKAPLGQIWMAATMHAKLNRRKLDKLNLIHICEEILNPSVPMALRLSGILMGGVVIVYERKVKLLYDDVTRLLVEINEAWKVKAVRDPRDRTLLPKSKTQARKEAVTLPEAREEDLTGIEQSLNDLSNAYATFGFQRSAYFAMQLDDVDGSFFNLDPQEELKGEHLHQAHPDNITLEQCFDSCQVNTDVYNHFERFDIEGDEGTQPNFSYGEHVEIPTTVINSPPQEEAQRAEEIPDFHGCEEAKQDEQQEGPVKKRKPRKQAGVAMDFEQTVIAGNIYQSWLKNASGIVSRRGAKKRVSRDISTMKVGTLMELPPLVFIGHSSSFTNEDIYYPKSLMELWMQSTQPAHDSPSARTSPPLPPEPSVSSPERHAMGFNFEDFHGGGGASDSLGVSIEKLRENVANDEIPMEIIMGEELRANLMNHRGLNVTGVNFFTPANDGREVRIIPSPEAGHGIPPLHAEVNPGRSNKKRPYSSGRHSSSSLEPVAEDHAWQFTEPNFKISRLSENGPTPDYELLVETGPTQTQQPIINPPDEKITDSIRMQMKSHFETPGAPQVESLNTLAAGMNRKGAALLFYQTCVLATRDVLRVKQQFPYGEILISKGRKM